jgi:hypothetical protein
LVEKMDSRSGVLLIDPSSEVEKISEMVAVKGTRLLLTPPTMRNPWNGGRPV